MGFNCTKNDHPQTSIACWGACLFSLLLSACGTGGKIQPVTGKVLFQGKPVPTGHVTFVQITDNGDTGRKVSYQIQNGIYQSPEGTGITQGKDYLVEIDGYNETSPQDEGQQRLFPLWKTKLNASLSEHNLNFNIEPLAN